MGKKDGRTPLGAHVPLPAKTSGHSPELTLSHQRRPNGQSPRILRMDNKPGAHTSLTRNKVGRAVRCPPFRVCLRSSVAAQWKAFRLPARCETTEHTENTEWEKPEKGEHIHRTETAEKLSLLRVFRVVPQVIPRSALCALHVFRRPAGLFANRASPDRPRVWPV